MGVISRRVLPACGYLCCFCPSLRTRSRQPVKRYKKLLTDAFPRSPKKWEKKNLEIGTALRPHDLSPADDFFSLHGEKKRGDVLFMGEYSHISMNFDDVSYLFTVPCRAASIVLVILDNYEVQQMSSGNSKQDFQCSQDENHLVEEVGRVKDHVSSFQDSWKKVFSVPQITTIEVDATVLEPYCWDLSRRPTYWSKVCLQNMAKLAKEATTELILMRLSSHQVGLLLSTVWVQATSPENSPANYEALAHTYSLGFLFSQAKVTTSWTAFYD
ncbi:hypothetical protein GW17_00014303 [Ensete ventricosum]|nr:hypothetical protein GW17_00014303 [Ensete ventricosum]